MLRKNEMKTQKTSEFHTKPETLNLLFCPACHQKLQFLADSKEMKCIQCLTTYPYKNGVFIFLKNGHYTASFGFQWKIHAETQLDKFNGTEISKERFYRQTKWNPEELLEKNLLEIGSGAGRFTQIALDAGAKVFSVEASDAVFVNFKNNHQKNLNLFKASLFNQPFCPEIFDYMFCFGVIQHTPNVEKAFKSLFPALKKGGKFCIDVYASPISYLHPRHILRPFTRRIKKERLYQWVRKVVPLLFPLSNFLYKIPWIGPFLARLIPIANWRYLPLKVESQYLEWSILDTYDWYSPAYEKPQFRNTVEKWCRALHLNTYEIQRNRSVFVIRGEK